MRPEGGPRVDQGGTAAPRQAVRALQILAMAVVAGLVALLALRLASTDRARNLVADVREGGRPAAPLFELGVIWGETGTWPEELGPALDDGMLALLELRGHPVVLNFWASWCVPCREEAPVLEDSARGHAGEVVFLGVDVQDFESDARRFLRELDVDYVSVRDSGSDTYDAYGLTGVPETYYLDASGRIVAHSRGAISATELEAGIAEATAPARAAR